MQQKTIKLFLHHAFKYKVLLFTSLFFASTTSVVGGFIAPLFIADLLQNIQAGSATLTNIWPVLFGYIGTQVYGEIIGWRIVLYAGWTMEVKTARDLYQRIFSSLNDQSLSFHANRFGGALVSQTSKLTNANDRFWNTIIWQLVPAVSGISAAIIILSFIFWQYALFMLCSSLFFVMLVFRFSTFLSTRSRDEAQSQTKIIGHFADVITNIMAVKSHGEEEREFKNLTYLTSDWEKKSLRTMRGFNVVSTGYSSVIAIMNVIALLSAVIATHSHIISIAVVYLCVTYTFTVARQLWEMSGIIRSYHSVMGDAHDMVEILQITPSVQNTSSTKLTPSQGKIDFKNVTFTHKERTSELLFKELNLSIKPGQKVGLVGHSGAGKSTITNLLLRFNDINSGAIHIDDQDISTVTQESLRKNIAYVPQEPLLFHRTLKENISYGRQEAADQEIKDAAKKAHALEFIEKLSDGFDTLVGERGVKLSGGQRQRIAIARAILKDAPILVLDEATSALDSESEKLIQDALKKLMQNRTTIVIAHRLSTISHLDRIIVLENGKIIEDGPHKELIAKEGTYAQLWSHQSGGFIEE